MLTLMPRRRAMLRFLSAGPQKWDTLIDVAATQARRPRGEGDTQAEQDIRSLREAGLIVRQLILVDERTRRWFYVITDRGRDVLLRATTEPELQLELMSPEIEFGIAEVAG